MSRIQNYQKIDHVVKSFLRSDELLFPKHYPLHKLHLYFITYFYKVFLIRKNELEFNIEFVLDRNFKKKLKIKN